MYYIFRAARVRVRNKPVVAEIVNPIDHTEYEPPQWWEGIPLIKPLPHLYFTVDPRVPIFDNYNIGLYQLYSKRMIDIIRTHGANYETFPATLLNRDTGQILSDEYAIFHLLETIDALDMAKSDLGSTGNVETIIESDAGDPLTQKLFADYIQIRKIVIKAELIMNPKPIFIAAEKKSLTIIHESLKSQFERLNITGCKYIPVEEYQLGFGL